MRRTKTVIKLVDVVDDLICNKCGKTLKKENGGISNYCGLEEVDMVCGYGSENDGSMFTFSLCEKCVLKIMSRFKIPAQETRHFM